MISKTSKEGSKFIIEFKFNGSRYWRKFKIGGVVKSFTNKYHSNNYGLLLNPHHKIM